MNRFAILFIVFTAIISCKERDDDANNSSADIILSKSSSDYLEALQGRSSDKNDPFEIRDVEIKGDSVNITVSYSGGCRRHTFEIIWNGIISPTDPPSTGLIILHDSNGDMCEALITETLKFSMANLANDILFDTLYVNILNGCNHLVSVSAGRQRGI